MAHPVFPVALLVLGLVVVLLLTVPTQDLQQAPGFMYGIVLDAGSSHTALYIYKWPADKHNGTGVVTQHTECHVKGGGISSYADQPGAAGKSLEKCLDQAVVDVPKERHKVTPVYLGATAGMRLLDLSSPLQSTRILSEVGRKIQSYPFNYQGAAILSGQEEGAYGWVTVNYLLENFIKYSLVGRWLSPDKPTSGALDFGGASTQITFETQETVEDKADLMKLRLYGRDYSLYTHSFLCYGRDQVLKRILAHIVKSQGYPGTVYHPCYPSGHRRSVKLETVFDSACTRQYEPSDLSSRYIEVHGEGRYDRCLNNVSELFSFEDCPFSQCSFDRVFQPRLTGPFMAFAAFFYTHSFLQRVTDVNVQTPLQMGNAAEEVCGMTYNQMLQLAQEQEPRLQDYCASSVFIQILMLRGYGFDDTSFPKITFQKKAGDASLGWALGYMLALSNMLPEGQVEIWKALSTEVWGTLVFLVAGLLVATLAFIIHLVYRVRKKDSSDGPL